MSEHTGYLPGLSAVEGKQVQAAFDGGMPSSDAGVLLLRQVERRLGIGDRLAACLRDPRDPLRIDHTVAEMIRFRVFAIAAGYDDADDCDVLRTDPLFKMALGRGPSSGGGPLCSQPTMSRLENAPSRAALLRMLAAMVDLFCESWRHVPCRVVLNIDDTWDATHGRQQLALFNAPYDGCGFLPIHIYEATGGKLVIPSCGRASHPRGWKHASSSGTSSGASAATGQGSASCCVAMATKAGPRSWTGARTTTSATSSASSPTRRSPR